MAKRGSKVGGVDDPVWTAPDVADRELRSTKRHTAIVAILVVLLVFVVALPAGLSLLSRKDYGTFAFWSVPQRIGYCGRTYVDGSAVLGNARQFTYEDSARPARWTLTSHTFSLRPIYAVVTDSRYSICTMALYIPLGGQRWEVYPLSGGP